MYGLKLMLLNDRNAYTASCKIQDVKLNDLFNKLWKGKLEQDLYTVNPM